MSSTARIAALGASSLVLMSASIAIAAPQDTPEVVMQRVAEFDREADRPSLSPDGRWIAFALAEDDERYAIWIVPSSGGEPTRLTDGRYTDIYPRWFPSSTRVAFASDRNDGGGFDFYPWAVSFDPGTGEPREMRQLGIDRIAPPASGLYVSPDGERIAYVHSQPEATESEIRVAPVGGGRPRTLAKHDAYLGQVRWTPDGDSVVYMQRTLDSRRTVARVPVSGGPPEELWSRMSAILIASDGRSFLSSQGPNEDQSQDWAHLSLAGEELGRARVPARFELDRFDASGRITASERDVVAPIWIGKLNGGSRRELTADSRHYWVYDWASDESGILAWSDNLLLLQIPPDGGDHRVLLSGTGAKGARFSSRSGEVLFLDWYDDDVGYLRLARRNPETGLDAVLTDSFPQGYDLRGRGGSPLRDGRRDLFLEAFASGDSLRVVGMAGGGTRDTLLALPSDRALGPFAVADTVIAYAWTEESEFGVTTVVHGSSASPVRQSMDSLGLEANAVPVDLIWSHSGNHLAIVTSSDEGIAVAFVDWRESTLVPVATQRLDAKHLWDTQWLPDGSGVVAAAMGIGGSFDTALLFVPLDPDQPAGRIASGDIGSIYSFAVSPSGGEVAYMMETYRGTTIWLLEIP